MSRKKQIPFNYRFTDGNGKKMNGSVMAKTSKDAKKQIRILHSTKVPLVDFEMWQGDK
jgi:type II secretory pathway component PulF